MVDAGVGLCVRLHHEPYQAVVVHLHRFRSDSRNEVFSGCRPRSRNSLAGCLCSLGPAHANSGHWHHVHDHELEEACCVDGQGVDML